MPLWFLAALVGPSMWNIVIILAAIAYGIGGFRNGAVVGLFSTIGFFGGAGPSPCAPSPLIVAPSEMTHIA